MSWHRLLYPLQLACQEFVLLLEQGYQCLTVGLVLGQLGLDAMIGFEFGVRAVLLDDWP